MKPNPSHSMTAMPKSALLALGSVLLFGAPKLAAQSAEAFHKEQPAGESSSSAPDKESSEAAAVDTLPSRFAGDEIEPYIAARKAVFSMRNRATDPFGLYQDPNAKPVIQQLASKLPTKRQAALPPTPLVDIVSMIRVTTIMPREKKFLVGIRSFSEGEEFPLVFQGKTLRMKILEVTGRRILFRNLESGEDAALETNILPPGMVPGSDGLRPPGMVVPTENLPLNLGAERDSDPNP